MAARSDRHECAAGKSVKNPDNAELISAVLVPRSVDDPARGYSIPTITRRDDVKIPEIWGNRRASSDDFDRGFYTWVQGYIR